MKAEVFEKISRVIIICGFIAISCFLLALCLFPFVDSKPDYTSAFSFFASMTSAIATIGASYIAALLFNDWRDQEKYKICSNLAMECLNDYYQAKEKMFFYLFQHIYKTNSISFKELDDIFYNTHNKIIKLNQILKRFEKEEIEIEIINSFYVNNFAQLIEPFKDPKSLERTDDSLLDGVHKKFIENQKMKLLPEKLLDILKIY